MRRYFGAVRVAHRGQPDGPQKNGVGRRSRFLGARRHVAAGFLEVSGAGQQVLAIQIKPANTMSGGVNDSQGRVGDIDTDAVAFNNGNFKAGGVHGN